MPRKLFKRYLPAHHTIRNHHHLRHFGERLHDPNLWHLNRFSVSGAFAVGLFIAFVPMPFQMILAAAAAIALRVNLPISVALVWVSNPVTLPLLIYAAYRVGAWVLGIHAGEIDFQMSVEWLEESLHDKWQPFLLGCFLLGSIASVAGYFIVRGFWRVDVIQEWARRQRRRAARLRDAAGRLIHTDVTDKHSE